MLKAAIFVRRNGASGAGQVGWAFEYGDGKFNVGAVENTAGYFLDGPRQMAFWTQRTDEPVAPVNYLTLTSNEVQCNGLHFHIPITRSERIRLVDGSPTPLVFNFYPGVNTLVTRTLPKSTSVCGILPPLQLVSKLFPLIFQTKWKSNSVPAAVANRRRPPGLLAGTLLTGGLVMSLIIRSIFSLVNLVPVLPFLPAPNLSGYGVGIQGG